MALGHMCSPPVSPSLLPRLPEFTFSSHALEMIPPKFNFSSMPPLSLSPPVIGSKRRYPSDDVFTPAVSAPASKLPCPLPPPSLRLPSQHECGADCGYCSRLTNLDIAAYYWSLLAMRSYEQLKTAPGFDSISKVSEYKYCKPPSPSGSLSSLDSEPLSPSSSVTSETSSKSDLENSKYPCQVCHKSYSHPRLLNRHMQSHTPYKKHHCPRCGKGFNDAFDLKRHVRTHTGIKPFQCSLCEKSFTQRCSLEAHLTRVHNVTHKFAFRERRPKLFVCEKCGLTFQDNTEFRQHEKDSGCVSATTVTRQFNVGQ